MLWLAEDVSRPGSDSASVRAIVGRVPDTRTHVIKQYERAYKTRKINIGDEPLSEGKIHRAEC